MVVLDTSALLYWTFAPERLTARAATAIAATDQIIVNSISIWEIGLKVKRGKLELPLSPAALVTQLEATDRVRIEPVSVAAWLTSLSLVWEHRDPADRVIVATASLCQCALVTSDLEIQSFYTDAIW